MGRITVTRDDAAGRFDLTVDGEPAGVLEYRLDAGVADMFHTEVFGPFAGQGLGAVLARHALDTARDEGWRIVPSCWFVRDYIAAHRADADLLA